MTLYIAISWLDFKDDNFQFSELPWLFLNFFAIAIWSIALGGICGLFGSYITKKTKHMMRTPVYETIMITTTAFLSFFVAEVFEVSGIISTFVSCINVINRLLFEFKIISHKSTTNSHHNSSNKDHLPTYSQTTTRSRQHDVGS